MDSFTITVPLYLEVGIKKKKKQYLNLNVYRNLPFHTNNNLKKAFKELVGPLLPDIHYKKYVLMYEVHLPNKLKRDINNVCSIIDKFFADAFVESGKAKDDNYEHLPLIVYKFGSVTPGDGHVRITVQEISNEVYDVLMNTTLKDLLN